MPSHGRFLEYKVDFRESFPVKGGLSHGFCVSRASIRVGVSAWEALGAVAGVARVSGSGQSRRQLQLGSALYYYYYYYYYYY